MESNIRLYLAILQQEGVVPSFPITAKVAERHPEVIKELSKKGVELAVHGYKHIDHTLLPAGELLRHLQKAVHVFQAHNISFSGFRFPYFKWNQKCFEAIHDYPFEWDSSHTVLWDVIDNRLSNKKGIRNYQRMLDQYNYRSSSDCLSLPKFSNDLLEIPVSLPDDDLVERLGLRDSNAVTEIWAAILRKTHSQGELFTLQLHPERIFMFKDSLNSIIRSTKELVPRVWITSLNNIYKWWKEKYKFTVELTSIGNGKYEVDVNCSPRATLLVRSPDFENDQFIDGYTHVKQRTLLIKSPTRPILGIPKYSARNLVQFLKNEGFVFEVSEEEEVYSVYLAQFADFSEENEMEALEIIHSTDLPLVRFWRWPDGCRSALAITGDIDGLTLIDFFLRLFVH